MNEDQNIRLEQVERHLQEASRLLAEVGAWKTPLILRRQVLKLEDDLLVLQDGLTGFLKRLVKFKP